MFIKLTDADTSVEFYVNENHIIKIVPNAEGPGAFAYLVPLTPKQEEPHVLFVHESADDIFRMMGRMHR